MPSSQSKKSKDLASPSPVQDRLQQRTAELEAQLEAVFQAVSDGIVVCDMTGKLVLVNNAAVRINRFVSPDAMLKDLAGLGDTYELRTISGEIVPLEQWPLNRVLRGESLSNWELYRRHRGTGQEWFFSVSGEPILDAAGQQILAVVTTRDITAAKNAEEALIRSEKLASVGRMAATIAHEINNPLAAVMNLLFLAQHNPNCPSSIKEDLGKAEAELMRVSHITRQVLGFYRDSSHPCQVSLPAVLDEALTLFELKIMAKQVAIERQYREPLQITAIAGELRQVISNILANSLDAVADGGTLTLRIASRTKPSGMRAARITIADNGKGIEAAALPRIFEPLFTTKELVGTGLGLWVSRQLVEKHGGSIRFRSSTRDERRGTTFVIDLPMVSTDSIR